MLGTGTGWILSTLLIPIPSAQEVPGYPHERYTILCHQQHISESVGKPFSEIKYVLIGQNEAFSMRKRTPESASVSVSRSS